MPAYVGGEFDVAGLKWIPSVPGQPGPQRAAARERAGAAVRSRDRAAAGGDGRHGGQRDAHRRRHRRRRAAPGARGRQHRLPARRRRARPHAAGCAARRHAGAPHRARVRSRHARAERFCERQAAATGLDVVSAASAEEAVRGAQVVVPATMAVEPTFQPEWLDEGVTVVLVSSLDGPLSLHAATDLLVVDDWEHESTHEGRYASGWSGGILAASGGEAVELADVVAGGHPGRTDRRPADRRLAGGPGHGRRDDREARVRPRPGAGRGHGAAAPPGPPVWE